MSLLGERSASFIIRIWRDDREDTFTEVVWRGSIENVRSGDKVYFRKLAVIEDFLKQQLLNIGIEPGQQQPGSPDASSAPPDAKSKENH
jgi:hypothetical protein